MTEIKDNVQFEQAYEKISMNKSSLTPHYIQYLPQTMPKCPL